MQHSTVVDVYSAADNSEAFFVKAMLEDAGIEATVVGDILAGAAGGIPLGQISSPRVWVAPDDASRARQLIEAWQSNRLRGRVESVTEHWTCPGCGEEIESDLETCWNCGTTTSGRKDPNFAAETSATIPDEPADTTPRFNPRVFSLMLLLLAGIFAACGLIGASIATLIVYGIVSGFFSWLTGWLVTLLLPKQDDESKEDKDV